MFNFINVYQHTIDYIVILFLVFLYNYVVFALVGAILEKPKLNILSRIIVSLFNTLIFYISVFLTNVTTDYLYIIIFIVYSVEFYIFHKDALLRVLFLALSCIIHIMSIRSICVGLFSVFTGSSIFELVNNTHLLVITSTITLFVLNIANLLVFKFIPMEKLKIINQHKEHLWYIASWLAVFSIYLVVNSKVYSISDSYSLLNNLQIVVAVAILLGSYILLFFSMKSTILLGYKEKNSELELELQKQQQLKNLMLKDSISTYEYNLSKNEIVLDFDESNKEIVGNATYCYDEILIVMSKQLVHGDDIISFMEFANASKNISNYENGKQNITIDYRRLMVDTGEYIWVRATTNLVKDIVTGDIKGFTYIKNIDKEKKLHLELKYKAETDELTGLYNREMTVNLISGYLFANLDSGVSGVLFIIKIDNFKYINKSMGHISDDNVLYELGRKINVHFRDVDILGRMSSDEFIGFSPGMHHKIAIEAKATEICDYIFNTYHNDGKNKYKISGNIGIAVAPVHGVTFDELYKKAEIALYISKKIENSTSTIYQDEDFTEYNIVKEDLDLVTGLMSFNQFKSEASEILARNGIERYVFIRVDINNFRVINGMYGFNEGDELLRNTAEAIKITKNKDEIFARLMNDNFVILTPYTSDENLYKQYYSFKESFNKIHKVAEKDYTITFTCGFCKIESDETDINELLEKASLAHRTAKTRDNFMFCYDDSIRENAIKLKTMENTMEAALKNGELQAYLQPKYNIIENKIVGAEALVRWVIPNSAIIPPNEYIPLFEKNGFIIVIDLHILEQVCKMQRDLLDRGITPVVVSVNQSKLVVSLDNYVNSVCNLLKKYNIDANLIELELTETIIYDNIVELKKTIDELREIGFIISIDDFGSGYSSLNMLKEINADVLKIDRELLNTSEDNERGKIVLFNVIRLAKELKMSVVVEGVETKKQANLVSELGCDIAQGFLFAKPMPMVDFVSKL